MQSIAQLKEQFAKAVEELKNRRTSVINERATAVITAAALASKPFDDELAEIDAELAKAGFHPERERTVRTRRAHENSDARIIANAVIKLTNEGKDVTNVALQRETGFDYLKINGQIQNWRSDASGNIMRTVGRGTDGAIYEFTQDGLDKYKTEEVVAAG